MTMTATAARLDTYRGNGQSGVIDRLPPCSIEAEEATIGSCLIDPSAVDRVAAIFGDETAPFFIVKNQWVWSAIDTLSQRGDPVDFVTVTRELKARNQLDELGGPAYISQLINGVPTAIHAEGYARIVAEYATRRRMLETAENLAQAAFDEGELQVITLDRAQRSLDALKRSRESGARNAALRFFAAGESLDPLPPVEWVVKDIIRAASLSALVGGAKLGKSFACLDAGANIAAGRSRWIGRQIKQCPVIYLDEENGEILMRQRLAMVLRGNGIEDRDLPLYVLPMPRLNFSTLPDRNRLADFITERGAGLVIVDSFIDALTLAGAKESVAEDQQRVLLAMRYIAETTGAAFLVIHHENRSGTYRGSSALPGAVDVMLSVKGKAGQGRLDFELELSRSSELQKFSALADFGPDTFTLSPAAAVNDIAPHFSKSQEYVMRYLQSNGAAKVTDIMLGADTCTPNAARAAVYSLTHMGRLYRMNPGEPGDAIYDRVGIDLNPV